MSASQALERLARSARPRFVFVSHAFGGGVARHIADLARLLEDDAEVLLLQPGEHIPFFSLRWLRRGEDLALWFRVDEWPAIEDLLARLAIARVHFHHVHGLPESVLDLPARLACAHDVTLHDYFPACANYHLTDGAGRFCGGHADCHRCLEQGPAQWPLTIDAWRERFAALLALAQRVIAPSRDAGARLAGFFPRARIVVWPHPEEAPARDAPPLRVLVPGAISPEKGLALLEACVADAARRALPLHFRVLGYTARPIAAWPRQPYSIAGEFPEGRLPELLAIERGDVAFFPAQCAETFSYTLSACLAAGLPVVATDLGALPERLAGHPGARIVPWTSDAAAVNDALLEAAAPRTAATMPTGATAFAAYRDLYMAGISTEAPRAVAVPAIEPRWTEVPPARVAPWTLGALFDDAVGCGRASSLELLERTLRLSKR